MKRIPYLKTLYDWMDANKGKNPWWKNDSSIEEHNTYHLISAALVQWLKSIGVPTHIVRKNDIFDNLTPERTSRLLYNNGCRPGYPDWEVTVPRGGYHACFIEQKSNNGWLNDNQINVMRDLISCGYCCFVCRTATEVISTVALYLDGFWDMDKNPAPYSPELLGQQ